MVPAVRQGVAQPTAVEEPRDLTVLRVTLALLGMLASPDAAAKSSLLPKYILPAFRYVERRDGCR